MSHLARIRLILARRPWLYWLAVGCCALSLAALWGAASASAERERRAWGTERTVWVTTAPADRGDAVTAEARRVPAALVPDTALDAPPEGWATHGLAAGEILVAADLGTRADAGHSTVVVAIALSAAPQLVPGDTVAVLTDGRRHCDGVVDHVAEEVVDVALPDECAVGLGTHLLAGTVLLARTG